MRTSTHCPYEPTAYEIAQLRAQAECAAPCDDPWCHTEVSTHDASTSDGEAFRVTTIAPNACSCTCEGARWRRVRPEVVREVGERYQEAAVSNYVPRQEAAPQPIVEDTEHDELLDPWVERAQRLRPTWTSDQQGVLARALRHAPNDGAALVMAPLMLGVARRC